MYVCMLELHTCMYIGGALLSTTTTTLLLPLLLQDPYFSHFCQLIIALVYPSQKIVTSCSHNYCNRRPSELIVIATLVVEEIFGMSHTTMRPSNAEVDTLEMVVLPTGLQLVIHVTVFSCCVHIASLGQLLSPTSFVLKQALAATTPPDACFGSFPFSLNSQISSMMNHYW